MSRRTVDRLLSQLLGLILLAFASLWLMLLPVEVLLITAAAIAWQAEARSAFVPVSAPNTAPRGLPHGQPPRPAAQRARSSATWRAK